MEPAPIKIRILIVDDQLVVREGLRMLIENHPGTKVIAMASTRSEALDILSRETCDLIILDLELVVIAPRLSYPSCEKRQEIRACLY